MTTKDTGGSAFPRIDGLEHDSAYRTSVYSDGGMTLRDYFAAKAMAAMIGTNDKGMRGYMGWREEMGRQAYAYADAMIQVRGDS